MRAHLRSWKVATGHSVSPRLLAAIAGGAGLAGASFSDNNRAEDDSGSRQVDAETHDRRQPVVMPRVARPTAPTPQMLATSNIIATSDASAERSASLAAAARLTGKALPVAINEEGNVKGNVKGQTGGGDAPVATVEMGDESGVAQRMRIKPTNRSNGGADNSSSEDQSQSNNGRRPIPSPSGDDSYPAFTPYHHSLLKKYLTPEVWAKLSKRSTSYGTTVEDIIRAGLALPIGANPPRRVGVLVGDAECYELFKDLIDPILLEYHGIKSYEEWNDPELPKEQYFSAGAVPASPATTLHSTEEDEYGVIKSSGAAEDVDDDNDSSFLLDEEDDMFVERETLPSSPPPLGTSQSSAQHVAAITSKRKASLRRHPTIINNPRLVTNREADPEGKYIVSTRIRLARSLDGVKFPPVMSRSDRRKVERLIHECTRHFQAPNLAHGTYLPILQMSNDQNLDLIERHILFDNPNEWTIASGLGRDWPDGRALYANVDNLQSETPDFMIWVNEEDHLRIMCLRGGGDIQGVFTTLMNGVRELERELRKRGWHFAYDSRLGYLTSCPTNVGTTMRASVHVRLTNLGRLPGFFELVERLKLEVRGKYGETDRHYTGVFDISNAERLGKSEVHLINVMVEGTAKLVELEKRLEAGESINVEELLRELPSNIDEL
ncbi:hypothetical protein ACHAXT_012478 [Thalassiosira profunda]